MASVRVLRVSDIDFPERHRFRIERAAQRIRQNGNTRLIADTEKRIFCTHCSAAGRYDNLPEKAVSGLPENAYLLTGRSDKPMEPRNYQYYFLNPFCAAVV